MTHTPEPWFAGEQVPDQHLDGYSSISIGPVKAAVHYEDTICEVWCENHDGQANVNRIVACVNALAGISNEQIERDAKLYPHVREMQEIVESAKYIRQHHDALMSATNDEDRTLFRMKKNAEIAILMAAVAKLGDDQ